MSQHVKDQLEQEGVEQVWATHHAFFAKFSTGHFVAWGDSEKGGSIPAAVKEQLEQEGVDQVCASEYAFFA